MRRHRHAGGLRGLRRPLARIVGARLARLTGTVAAHGPAMRDSRTGADIRPGTGAKRRSDNRSFESGAATWTDARFLTLFATAPMTRSSTCPMPAGYKPGKTKLRRRLRHGDERPGQGHLQLVAGQVPPGQGPDRRARSSSKATSTSTPARSTPTATARSSSSTTAWSATWTWARTSGRSTRTSPA